VRSIAAKIIIAATVVCGLVVAAIYAGLLSFLASDGKISTYALWAIVTYWAVFVLLVLLVAGVVRRPREMLLALVATVIFLALTEVAVRVLDVDRARTPYSGLSSSRFHHVNAPDVAMSLGIYDGHTVVIRDNEDGLRCDLSREEFLKYPNRVLVMGDSFVWGLGVRQDSMVTEVMQRTLRERFGQDRVAVLAGAAISYSPFLYRQLYHSVFSKYRPTAVMLVLDASDIGDDVKYARENTGTPDSLHFDLPDETLGHRYLAVYRIAEPLLKLIGRNLAYPYNTWFRPHIASYDYYDFTLTVGGTAEKNRYFIYRHPLKDTRPYFDATLATINAIAAEVRRDGAHFVLVVAPRYHQWSDRECPGNWEVRQWQYTGHEPYVDTYTNYFAAAADTLDYDVYSLLPAFRSTRRFPLVFATDPHWNDAGHAFVAGLLDDYLIDHRWVK